MRIGLTDLPISVQSPDGSYEASNTGFQQVTRRVLRSAPCSVAILVDRGFGGLHQVRSSQGLQDTALLCVPPVKQELPTSNHGSLSILSLMFFHPVSNPR